MLGSKVALVAVLVAASLSVASAASDVGSGNAESGAVTVTLPRAAGAGEAVWLELHAGNLARGAILQVRSSTGALLLAVASPTGAVGQGAGTFKVPIPSNLVAEGKVSLKLEVKEPGAPARPPRPGEVESIEPIYVPVGD
jgi:hypothetical protein